MAKISSHRLPNGTIPVLLSADTAGLVTKEASAILTYVLEHPRVSPDRIADMVFRTRTARRHRTLLMARDRDELIIALRAVVDGTNHPAVVQGSEPANTHHLGYVFPGQGGQRPGMGRAFYVSSDAYRAEADRCATLFEAKFNRSPLNYLLHEEIPTDDSASVVQPALFTQMVGLAAMWRSVGVNPDVTVGHSQGEIAAAYVSGAMSLADAVTVVGVRAGIVDKFGAESYAMAVAATDRDTCEELIARRSGWAEVSVINSPSLAGISGDRETIEDIVESLTARGVFSRVIPVQYPAHTSGINTIGAQVRQALQERLDDLKFEKPEIDCLGATLGGPITTDLPVDQYWFWNLRNPVRFDRAIAAAVAQGVDTFIELAEHPVLQLAIQENLRDAAVQSRVIGTSTRESDLLDEFTKSLAQVMVHDLDYQWESLHNKQTDPVGLPLLNFPNVGTNDITLWLPYNLPSAQPTPLIERAAPPPPATAEVEDVVTTPAWLLTEDWIRLTQRSLVPPRTFGIIDHTGECGDLAAALCAAAADTGSTAQTIQTTDSTDDFDAVVVLVPELPQLTDQEAAANVASFFGQHAWWPGHNSAVNDYWLVTVGGESVTAQDPPPHPVHAAAGAGFRSVGAEYPGTGFRHLDLSPESAHPDSAKPIVMALHTAGEPELALRDGTLYAKRLVERQAVPADATRPEHVLVTGGTGKLGLEFCEHFARQGARRITLVSRSGETAAVTGRLTSIRRDTPAEIRVVRCDISDEAAVADLAEKCGATPTDLIIHAAIDYSDDELADVTTEKVDSVLQAKVLGISHVLKEFPRTADCRVVLCSSLASAISGRGQIVYAGANRMLDTMAHRLRADGVDCVSVQWGQWTVHLDLDATGAAKLAGTGVLPMRPVDALSLGMSGHTENVAVAAFDLSHVRSVFEIYGYGPLLSGLTERAAQPSVAASLGDVRRRMIKIVSEVIGNSRIDTIDTTTPMVALGIDSLQALEFRRQVSADFGYAVEVSDLLGGASVDDVIAQINKTGPTTSPINTPAPIQLSQTPGHATHAAPEPSHENNERTVVAPVGDVRRRMIKIVSEVIGNSRIDTIDTTTPMVALGIDSLQALEFRRQVSADFGYAVEVSDLLGGASVDDVIAQINKTGPTTSPINTPAPIELSQISGRAKQTAEKAMPKNLDAEQIRSAREDLDRHGMVAMMRVLMPTFQDRMVRDADEIAEHLEFAPRHRWLLRRWLSVLTKHGHLTEIAGRGYQLAEPVPAPIREKLTTVCAHLGYRHELADFMQSSNDHLIELGQDRIRVQELLFPNGDMLTAEAGYRDNLISRYLNLAAREVVASITTRLQNDRSPVRILELGAGIGGTTDDVIAGLSGLQVDYHFTDVSTFFLAAAQERFSGNTEMRYGLLNLNTDLPAAQRYDIVIGANVIHNALHIGQSLRQLYDSINPGGAVVFIEACNANYQVLNSMKFLMSAAPGQPHPGQSDIRQGARIFLSQDEWNDQLAQAGFRPLLVLPEPDHPMYMLDQRVVVAVRD